jgi:hypothetical protein
VPRRFESFTELVKPAITPIPGGSGINYHSQYFQPQYEFTNDDHSQWHSPQGPHPIDHVICYWHQPYFYYARSRQRADGSVPHARHTHIFRAPCSIVVKDCGAFHLTWSPNDPPQIWKARSDIAVEPK